MPCPTENDIKECLSGDVKTNTLVDTLITMLSHPDTASRNKDDVLKMLTRLHNDCEKEGPDADTKSKNQQIILNVRRLYQINTNLRTMEPPCSTAQIASINQRAVPCLNAENYTEFDKHIIAETGRIKETILSSDAKKQIHEFINKKYVAISDDNESRMHMPYFEHLKTLDSKQINRKLKATPLGIIKLLDNFAKKMTDEQRIILLGPDKSDYLENALKHKVFANILADSPTLLQQAIENAPEKAIRQLHKMQNKSCGQVLIKAIGGLTSVHRERFIVRAWSCPLKPNRLSSVAA